VGDICLKICFTLIFAALLANPLSRETTRRGSCLGQYLDLIQVNASIKAGHQGNALGHGEKSRSALKGRPRLSCKKVVMVPGWVFSGLPGRSSFGFCRPKPSQTILSPFPPPKVWPKNGHIHVRVGIDITGIPKVNKKYPIVMALSGTWKAGWTRSVGTMKSKSEISRKTISIPH